MRSLLVALFVFTATLRGAGLQSSYELKLVPAPDALAKTQFVDVNLGESPEDFTRALWKQLTGEELDHTRVASAAAKLGTPAAPRRIDLALILASEARVSPNWTYSDPWVSHPPLPPAPPRAVKREVGAVMMFFFTSPHAPNGGAGWANTHVPGMFAPDPGLQYPGTIKDAKPEKAAYYHPANPGFWFRELGDARNAGLDFVLLNTYGPDLVPENLSALRDAIDRLAAVNAGNVVRIGLFDDTWTWGQPYFGPFWETLPDCRDPERASILLYEAKWRPFFQSIPRERWHTVRGRPLIYFYNNNTVRNTEGLAAVLRRMRERFAADFGVEPFIALDSGYGTPAGIDAVTDAGFQWFTHETPGHRSVRRKGDVELTHAMVRWDDTARNNQRVERVARADDMLHKDDRILRRVLDSSQETDLLVFATWNDLGEGTGINRAYDYYWGGQWRRPDHFMDLIRRSQAGEKISP